MKRVFSQRYKALAVPYAVAFSIGVTLAIGVPSLSHADAKSLWNPKHWFNSQQVAPDAATDARKKAEQAQQAAEQAMQEAQKALERAAEARRQADALEQAGLQGKKPVVTEPTTATASSPASEIEASQQTIYRVSSPIAPPAAQEATSESVKKEAWNPVTWFQQDNPKTQEKGQEKEAGLNLPPAADQSSTSESAASSQQTEPQKPSQPEQASQSNTEASQAESQAETNKTENFASQKRHGSWNLTNLFTKPSQPQDAESTTQTTGQPSKPEAAARETQAEPVTEVQSEATTEKTQEASAKGRGGWNLLNILSKPEPSENAQASASSEKGTQTDAQPRAAEQDQSAKTKAALIETEKGNIAIEFYPDQAPQTVANFVKLVDDGFYNRFNMKFHRVVPGFVIQTGDPTGTGAGGSKQRVPLEVKNKLSHNGKGVVAMARGADPDSATSQFYITLAPQASLDGKYAIFGRVISGMDVLSKIEKDDMMYGIRLVDLSSVVRDQQPEKKKFFSSLF